MKIVETLLKCVLLITVFLPGFLFCQPGLGESLDLTPKSPESASLMRAIDIPVGHYTGTANISVPLASLSDGDIGVSVSLSYSTGGHRVNEVASWVGLGWSLNAGGMITRKVNGLPDDIEALANIDRRGFLEFIETYSYEDVSNPSIPSNTAGFPLYDQIANGCYDTQPDEFYFQAGAYSGKFAFDWSGNLVVTAGDKVEVSPQFSGDQLVSWQIITADGVEYVFEELEITRNYSAFSQGAACTSGNRSYISGWYLSRMRSPKPDGTLYFEYQDYAVVRNFEKYETQVFSYATDDKCQQNGKTSFSTSRVTIDGKRPRKIYDGKGGEIVFIADSDNRTDTEGLLETSNFKSLGEVKLQRGGKVLKRFILNYESGRSRLLLSSVQEQGGSASIPAYEFSYNSVDLPAITSRAVDHWGFYNGSSEHTLLPSYVHNTLSGGFLVTTGSDREPDLEYARAMILEEVVFPEKGRVKLEYELNNYSYVTNSFNGPTVSNLYEYETADRQATGGALGSLTTPDDYVVDITPFTIGAITEAGVKLSVYGDTEGCFFSFPKLYIEEQGGSGSVIGPIVLNPIYDVEGGNPIYEVNLADRYLDLGPGDYHLRCMAKSCEGQRDFIGASLSWQEVTENQITTKNAGGLRVLRKRVIEPVSGTTQVYRYEYLSDVAGKSSGVIHAEPQYVYREIQALPETEFRVEFCEQYHLMGASSYGLADGNGNHVGYHRVIEYHGESGQNGKIEYEYTSQLEYADEVNLSKPFGNALSNSFKTGLLTKMVMYDQGGSEVQEVSNSYEFITQDVPSAKIVYYISGLPGESIEISPYEDEIYRTWFKPLRMGYSKQTHSVKVDYLSGGNISTQTDYVYDGNLQNLLQEEFANSDGRVHRTYYEYAEDLNLSCLTDRHMVGIPVITKQEVNNHVVAGSGVDYAVFTLGGSDYCLPEKFYNWEGSDWDTLGTVTAYTADGYIGTFDKKYYEDPLVFSWYGGGNPNAPLSGLLESKTYSNHLWSFTYEADSRLLETSTTPDQRSKVYSYDGLQRLQTVEEKGTDGSLKHTTRFDYTYDGPSNNNIKTTILYADNTPSKISTNYFDGLGRSYRSVNHAYVNGQDVDVEKVDYDNYGRVKSKTHLVGNMESYQYEASPLNRLLVTTLPDGNTIEMDYLSEGGYYAQSIQDEKGNITITKTDKLGRTIAVKNAEGERTRYHYDDWGNVDTVTSPLGNQYLYTYDYSQNHLASKSIPGGGTTYFDYYDDRDLLWTQTDANGNVLKHEYDEHDRDTAIYLGTQVVVQHKYYGSGHVDKLEKSIYALLDFSGTTEDQYLYDVYGRVDQSSYVHLMGIDITDNSYDNADRLLSGKLNHNAYQGFEVLNTYTYDNWDRSLVATNEIELIGQAEEIRNNLLYNERDQLRVKSIGGGLQNFTYTYEGSRGWLQQINDPLGAGLTLGGCEKDTLSGTPPEGPVDEEVDVVDINELLLLRQSLILQIQDSIDVTICPIVSCDPPVCSGEEAAQQQLCVWDLLEYTKTRLGSTQTIPCEDGSTEEIWVVDTNLIKYPMDVVRVRLCDGTERYVLSNVAEKICGPYEALQTITISSPGQVFEVEDGVDLTLLTLEELLTMVVAGEAPHINGYAGCGYPDCSIDPPNCDEVIVRIQQAAIEVLKPIVPEITLEDLPVTIYELATCTGDLLYILEEEYGIVEHTEMLVVDTIIIDSLNQEIPVDFVSPLEGECADLFYLYLDYEENGNIKSKNWQVYGRQEMQYVFDYDALNRLERGEFSEVSGRENTTSGNRYGVPLISYDADGNIERLTRNGITGLCPNGQPEFGAIDVLEYIYDHENQPNRLLSVTDGTGNEQGFNPGEGGGSYAYDGNGNLTVDGYKGLTITYNYLNLPELIQKGGDQIRILYDASGRKIQQEYIPVEGEGALQDYISGVEYRNAVLNSVYHEAGRAYHDEGDWRYEYFISDHLGNTQLTISDLNGNGCIDPMNDPSEILQENHYYPFGLNMDGPWAAQYEEDENGETLLDEEGNPVVDQDKLNRYQYNGKELTSDLGLNWNDYGARWYDPSIARWNAVDPLAEKYLSHSSYHFVANNPIKNYDVNGMEFTGDAWIWVNNLIKHVNNTQSRNNRRIEKHRAKIRSGKLSTKQISKRNRKVQRLQQQNRDLESLRGEVAELAASDQLYNVQVSNRFGDDNYDKAAAVYNSSNGNVDIVLPNSASIGLFAHELHHAYQFETGTTSLTAHDGNLNSTPIGAWLAYDQQDEVNAYRVQGLFGSTHEKLPAVYSNRPVGPISVTGTEAIINLSRLGMFGEIPHAMLQSLAQSSGMAFRWSRNANGQVTKTSYGPR